MTPQPTQLLSRVWSGPVGICVIGLQLYFPLHSSLIPDCLVGSGPTYDSTVELGWLMCHGLKCRLMTYYFVIRVMITISANKHVGESTSLLSIASIMSTQHTKWRYLERES